MAKQLGQITKSLNEYAGTAATTGIVAVTTGIEQLTTLAVYRCPCVSQAQLGNCSTTDPLCAPRLNLGYGLSFILAPAIALFVFGMASSPKFWKMLTGCTNRLKNDVSDRELFAFTVCEVSGTSLVAPFTWMAIALLDGRFLACAITPLPYNVGTSASFASCEAVATAKVVYTSDAFQDNRSLSQLFGWISVASFLIVGFLVYSWTQCSSPLTYYHAQYYRLYRQSEEYEFGDEMKQMAQVDAEANVRKFMEERREKVLWDKISTVYEFHRDKKNLALYSHLHGWVLQEQEKESREKKKETEEMVPLLSNHDEEPPASDAGSEVLHTSVV